MKRANSFALLIGLGLTSLGSLAFAHAVPENAAAMSTVLQSLQSAGYPLVEKVDFDRDSYKAEAITIQGQKVEVLLNLQGTIVKPKKINSVKLSMLDAAKAVEAAGYKSISEIEIEHEYYEVKAINNEGKKTELKVDAMTGKISKKSRL